MKIIQTSYTHTGSTVLVNILYGLFEPNSPVICGKFKNLLMNLKSKKYLLMKTHELNIRNWVDNPEFFFICSERDTKYPDYFYCSKNILVIKYGDLLETKDLTIETIVSRFLDRLQSFLPGHLFTDINAMKNSAIDRLKKMNSKYEEIKDKDFSYTDNFFHIHGSHRNRACPEEIEASCHCDNN